MKNLTIILKEVPEAKYDEMLNVLPPFYINILNGEIVRGFAVSEPYIHIEREEDKKWVPTFIAYINKHGKFYKVINPVYFITPFEVKTSQIILN